VDTFHQVCICIGAWHYVEYPNEGSAYGTAALLGPVGVAFVACITQSFFLWRIWRLSNKNFVLPCILMPFILSQPIMALYMTYQFQWLGDVSHLTPSYINMLSTLTFAINGTAAAVDIVIATAMSILLAMGRSRFSKDSDRLFVRLVTVCANTGLWTALFGLLTITLIVTVPVGMIYCSVFFPLSPLYCNTLLANLNVRVFLRSSDVQTGDMSGSRSTGRAPRGLHVTLSEGAQTSTTRSELVFRDAKHTRMGDHSDEFADDGYPSTNKTELDHMGPTPPMPSHAV
jgi:hypothetical protein